MLVVAGGGYYGGGSGADSYCYGGVSGGGGSSYVGSLLNSQTIAGNSSMPNVSGTIPMTGNYGNGYARITRVG